MAATALPALAAGCATQLPPPGLDFRQAAVSVDPAAPVISIDGLPGGKAGGAGVGAATGAGTGVVVGALACVATGPFMPLCLAAVLPTTLVVGTVTGAAVGAARSEGGDARVLRRELIVAELAATPYATRLAEQLQKQARADYATTVELRPVADAASSGASGALTATVGSGGSVAATALADAGDAPPLRIEIALTEVGSEGKAEFALRLVARLKVFRPGTAAPLYDTGKEVQSETELTNDGWAADDGRALRAVLDRCVAQAARNFLADLLPPAADPRGRSRAGIGGKYSTSCEDTPADLKPAT
ncbi:MAG: hypothetical protein ABIQ06_08835 [Caldimonas sp.]